MKRLLSIIIAAVLLLTACSDNDITNAQGSQTTAAVYYGIVENTTPEMMDPAFWSTDSTVLMSASDIDAFNNQSEVAVIKVNGAGLKLSGFGESIPGDSVREVISECSLPDPNKIYDRNGECFADSFVSDLDAARDLDGIPSSVSPRYAIVTEHVIGRSLPTDVIYYDEPGDFYFESNVQAELYQGEGVAAIHTSSDGEWSFVITRSFGCWVKNSDLAFCRDADEWEKALNPDKFIVVTGEKIILDPIPSLSDEFTDIVYMGTKLKLSDSASEAINGRYNYAAYTVDIPVRDENGMLDYMPASVAISQDVNVGFLPLTSKEIMKQAFKYLGHIYGWGGTYGSNDCSGMVRQVMKCFGLEIPRNSGAIAAMQGLNTYSMSGMETEAKFELLKTLPAGTIMQIPGHIMIYLGVRDDTAYCISSCSALVTEADGKAGNFNPISVNCVCLTTLNTYRANGTTWLDNIAVCIVPTLKLK